MRVDDQNTQESIGLIGTGVTDETYMSVYLAPEPEPQGLLTQRAFGFASKVQSQWKKIAAAAFVVSGLSLTIAFVKPLPNPVSSLPERESLATVPPAVTPSRSAPTPAVTSNAALKAWHEMQPRVQAAQSPSLPNSQEVSRLQTRNRRLEALVEVLRQRPQNKKAADEQTSDFSQ